MPAQKKYRALKGARARAITSSEEEKTLICKP